MDDARQVKRARQACEPCRRKKSRCPGERPTCSYCERLGQQCFYNSDADVSQARHNRKIEYRIESLEGKMDQLIQHLNPTNSAPSTHEQGPTQEVPPTPRSRRFSNACWSAPPEDRRDDSRNSIQQDERLREAGKCYLLWCHSQPIALFHAETFLDTLKSRKQEVQLAIQALGLRFLPGELTPERQQEISAMGKESRRLVMECIVEGQVELSTLQTFCLLSLLDFADAKPVQAGLNLAMASHLANSLQAGMALEEPEEYSNCLRSIWTLQCLQGCVSQGGKLRSFSAPPSDERPSASSVGRTSVWTVPNPADLHLESQPDLGIVNYAAQLSEVWFKAREYAACRVGSNSAPPWSSQSDYSSVMTAHLEVDCFIPLKYRFSANREFSDIDIETLSRRRDYWGPYLFLQIVYSTIPCLLNHPFLLSMRLRNFRYTMPQSFIQQSFDHITRHAGWIMYFLKLFEQKSFEISDLSIAHCVAITATIHLQHSFVKDRSLRDKAQEGFELCIRFLRRMGMIWPVAHHMAQNLEKLQQSVVVVPSPVPSGMEIQEDREEFSIDAQLLWDILIYERAGRPGATLDQSMFRESATSRVAHHERHQSSHPAEFDLVGSAGISGHKSVHKEIPVYAPGEASLSPQAAQPGCEQRLPNAVVTAENGYFETVGGIGDPEGLFLQPNDFGKAIENWLDFDHL